MALDVSERTCTACGAVDPEGGLRLGPDGGGAEYEWFCRLTRQCVARCAENARRERDAGREPLDASLCDPGCRQGDHVSTCWAYDLAYGGES